MRLSIIIPIYNANVADLLCLLGSIRTQLAISWAGIETIIVNDAGEPADEALFPPFKPLRIRQISLAENSGPGMARQTGIDAAQGDYLMFCDADDVLQNVGAISAILQEIAVANEPDILITKWLEEIRTGTELSYQIHDSDWTWMHGKAIRASFLRHTGVRHHPGLRIHEDSYFLNCLSANDPRVQESDIISYVWRWHDDSITRRDNGAYSYDSLPDFLKAVGLADEYFAGIRPQQLPERIAYRVCYVYHLTHADGWKDHAAAKAAAEDAARQYISPYWGCWLTASEGQKRSAYAQTQRFLDGAIPEETLTEWILRIGLGG